MCRLFLSKATSQEGCTPARRSSSLVTWTPVLTGKSHRSAIKGTVHLLKCAKPSLPSFICWPVSTNSRFQLTAACHCNVRFYVALTCGRGTSKEPPADVALELCVRFKDRQILRRACQSGSWGDAERAAPFFPFIRDQPFKVATSVGSNCKQKNKRWTPKHLNGHLVAGCRIASKLLLYVS